LCGEGHGNDWEQLDRSVSAGNEHERRGTSSSSHGDEIQNLETLTCKQTAAVWFPVAWNIASSNAPAGLELTESTSLILNRRQMRKMNELEAPMHTAAIMTRGAFIDGFGISSTMCETASYPVSPKEPGGE
jgi:hypothetical protein